MKKASLYLLIPSLLLPLTLTAEVNSVEYNSTNVVARLNTLPPTAAGQSGTCSFAKGELENRELKLKQLKKSDYKQTEMHSAEKGIERWKEKVSQFCQ